MKRMLSLLTLSVVLTAVAVPAMAAIVRGPDIPPRGEPGRDHGYSTYACSDALGFLRRVHEEELDVIDNPHNVVVTPICEGDYGFMRSDGNAGALREHIAFNQAIMDALGAANYGSDDVVAIRFIGDDKVIIYVHTFYR